MATWAFREKSIKAFLSATIFVALLALNCFSDKLLSSSTDGNKTSIVSITQGVALLREAAAESFGHSLATKIQSFGKLEIKFVELFKKESILKYSLRVATHYWNNFYVYISHQGP